MGAASLQHRTPLLTQKETKRPDRNNGQKRAELAPAASGCVWFQPELAWLATSRTSRVDYLLPRQQQEQRTAAAGSTHENTAGRVLRLHRIQREYAYPVSLAIKSRIGLGRVPVKNDAVPSALPQRRRSGSALLSQRRGGHHARAAERRRKGGGQSAVSKYILVACAKKKKSLGSSGASSALAEVSKLISVC